MLVRREKFNPLFDPSCCTFKLDGRIRKQIDVLVESKDVEKDVRATLKELIEEDESNKNTLSYDSLVRLHKYIQRADPDYIDPFYIFSAKCKCIEPKPRDNKQLDNRLKQLRLRQSHMLYNSIASSVDRVVENKIEREIDEGIDKGDLSSKIIYSSHNNGEASSKAQSHMGEFRKLNGSVVAVLNSFLVYICTFLFCYKAIEYSIPQPNYIAQVLFGLAGSTVVAIAELYFLFRVL